MLKDGLLAEFDHEVGTTRRLLERLPDDRERLAWKPHPKSMSLGGLATHFNLPAEHIPIRRFFDLAAMPSHAAERPLARTSDRFVATRNRLATG